MSPAEPEASELIYDEENQTLTRAEIESRMTYHGPSERGIRRHAELSSLFSEIMRQIDEIVPAGREKSIAFTHLEEAKMMASAGVARDPRTV